MASNADSSASLAEALMQENVWLQQDRMEQAEDAFRQMCLQDNGHDSNKQNTPSSQSNTQQQVDSLLMEHVWFKQQTYESAEAWCQMVIAGTADVSKSDFLLSPATPTKRLHIDDDKAPFKKLKPGMIGDAWEIKLHDEMSSLSKSAKNIHRHLDDFEKNQQRKAQAIQDTMLRLNNAIEACQNRLIEELTQSSDQISWFRSQLQDIDSVISKTSKNLHEGNTAQRKRLAPFCKTMAEHMSKIDSNLNICIETCNGLQAEVPKSEINRIVGEIGKLSLFKKKQGSEKFSQKKQLVEKTLKDLLRERQEMERGKSCESDSSMEGNVSSSFSTLDSDQDTEGDKKSKGQNVKAKKDRRKGSGRTQVNGNRNNSSVATPTTAKSPKKQGAKLKTAAGDPKANDTQGTHAPPKKRTAQGSQAAQRKQDVFKFKGNSQSPKGQYTHQPGLLGPRPSVFGQADLNHSGSFSLQNFNTMGQVPQSFGGIQTMSGSRYPYQASGNFRFSGIQHQFANGRQMNMMGDRNQEATHQIKHNFPFNPHVSGQFGGNIEQQLNDIAQKLRQMQLAATPDYQLQQLMQETQRLKQIVAQKQSSQQQHSDRFQQQFLHLINAFGQQQQMQAQQPPEAKMAKSMPAHHQRMFHNRQHQLHQQQKKQKQQQNKHQALKKETPSKDDSETQAHGDKNSQKTGNNEKKEKQSPPNNAGASKKRIQRKLPSKNSKLIRIGMFNPYAQGDKHRAGVSSLVVLEDMGCVVVVDIINSCLKLYDVSDDGSSSSSLNHRLVTRLDLPRPYYMTRLTSDTVVVSRAGNTLSVVKVTKRRLEFLRDLTTEVQYYGLTFVEDGVVAGAAFKDNKIDMVCVQNFLLETATVVNDCKGPELVASLSATQSIVFVERTPDVCIRLVCVNTDGKELFANNLDSETSDVWNVACIGDRIVCSNKRNNRLKLYSKDGNFLVDMNSPGGTVKKPFAMAFSESGSLYVANDGAWDAEYEHSVTTEINVFSFS